MQKPQITSRNLQLLSEQMNHEAVAYKKCKMYESMVGDNTLKTLCNDIAQHHKSQFNALCNYLDSHN